MQTGIENSGAETPRNAHMTRVELDFVAFCLESYKSRHALSGDETAKIFCRYGVGDYLLEGYDILHSFGERQILDDIDRFIEVRKQKEAQ